MFKFDGNFDTLNNAQKQQVLQLMNTPTTEVPEKAMEIAHAYFKRYGMCADVFLCAFSEYVTIASKKKS